jgi:hypothetical protein
MLPSLGLIKAVKMGDFQPLCPTGERIQSLCDRFLPILTQHLIDRDEVSVKKEKRGKFLCRFDLNAED